MTKKVLSFVFAIAMLALMIPTYAMAATDSLEFVVNTTGISELSEGDEVSIPIKIASNPEPGFFAAKVTVNFDPDVFEFVSMTKGTELDGTYTINKTEYSCTYDREDTGDPETSNTTATPEAFFTITLKVKSGAAAGDTTISLSGKATDYDFNTVSTTFTQGTITIAGDTSGAKFVNGSQSLSYDEAKAEAVGAEGAVALTSPGADYYFAGWFSGLTITPDTNGYYVINAGAGVSTGTTFDGTELRPRYDADPEGGTYNALWIYDDQKAAGKHASMVMSVLDTSFILYMTTDDLSDTVGIVAIDRAMYDAAAKNGLNGGRIKLLRDMEISISNGDTNTKKQYEHYPAATGVLKLDLNGCTLKSYKGIYVGKFAYMDSPYIESSRGQGKIDMEAATYGLYIRYVDNMVMRHVDVVAHTNTAITCGSYFGVKMEHCNVVTKGTKASHYALKLMYKYDGEGVEIDNCTLETSSGAAVLVQETDAKITNTTIKDNSTAINTENDGLIFLDENSPDYVVTLGAGNKIESSVGTHLINSSDGGYVHFTSDTSDDNYYKVAAGKQVISLNMNVTTSGELEGKVPFTENGVLKFYEGYAIDYYSYDGTTRLYPEYVKAGYSPTGCYPGTNTPFDVEWDRDNLTANVHVGWYKAASSRTDGDAPVTPVTLSAITQANYLDYTDGGKLYSVQKLENQEGNVLISYQWGTASSGFTTYTDVPYYDLNEALDAMKISNSKSETNLHHVNIKLTDDIEVQSPIALTSYFNTDLTLDLNGHTLSFNSSDGLFYVGSSSSTRTHTVNVISTGDRGTIVLGDAIDSLMNVNTYTAGSNLYYNFSNLRIEDTVNNSGYLLKVQERTNAANTAILNATFNDVQIETAANAVYYQLGAKGASTINVDFADSSLKFGGASVLTLSSASNVGSSKLSVKLDASTMVKNADGTNPVDSTVTSYVTALSDSDGDGWWTAEVGSCTDGHTPGEATVETIVAKTCEADGQYDTVVKCTACDAVLSRVTTYTMAGHVYADPVRENVVNPTCTTEGSYDSVIVCTACAVEQGRLGVTVPATGHTWEGGTETTYHTCSVCNATEVARLTLTVTEENAEDYGTKTVTSYASLAEAADAVQMTKWYYMHNELDILQDTTAHFGFGADNYYSGFDVAQTALTVDLNGHTMTFDSPADWCCLEMFGAYWGDFVIQSTGAQGTIVIPDGAYSFIGGTNAMPDGLTIKISNVKFQASNLAGGCLIYAKIANGYNSTVTLENVEFTGTSAATVALWSDGTGGSVNVNLIDCKLQNTSGSVVALPWSDSVNSDGMVKVNLSGENLALTTSTGVAPIDAEITGYEDVTVTSPEGCVLGDPDGDNTYKLVTVCDANGHIYVDGTCSVCGATDPDAAPEISTEDLFDNRTGTTTPATITAPANGWKIGEENTFTVSCEKACVVGYTTDGGETYTRLSATDDGYTVTVTEGMKFVVAIAGDVDGNGLVRIADVTAAAQLEASGECTSYQKLLADMNGDGNLRIADVIALAQLESQG